MGLCMAVEVDEAKLKILMDIQKNIIDWLKFAEAKAAALVGLNLIVLFGLHRLNFDSLVWDFYLKISTFFLLMSASVCLMAIIPRFGCPVADGKDGLVDYKTPDSADLTFYGDISKFSKSDYVLSMANSFSKNSSFSDFEIWTVGQIWSVSRITVQKLLFFKFSAWLFLAVIFTPLGAYFLSFFKNVSSGEFRS